MTNEGENLFGVTSAGCTLQATAGATAQLTKSNGASIVIQTTLDKKRSTKPFSLDNDL